MSSRCFFPAGIGGVVVSSPPVSLIPRAHSSGPPSWTDPRCLIFTVPVFKMDGLLLSSPDELESARREINGIFKANCSTAGGVIYLHLSSNKHGLTRRLPRVAGGLCTFSLNRVTGRPAVPPMPSRLRHYVGAPSDSCHFQTGCD